MTGLLINAAQVAALDALLDDHGKTWRDDKGGKLPAKAELHSALGKPGWVTVVFAHTAEGSTFSGRAARFEIDPVGHVHGGERL